MKEQPQHAMNEYHVIRYIFITDSCTALDKGERILTLANDTSKHKTICEDCHLVSLFFHWHYFAERLAYFQRLARVILHGVNQRLDEL